MDFRKIAVSLTAFFLLLIIFIPFFLASADGGLVPCGNGDKFKRDAKGFVIFSTINGAPCPEPAYKACDLCYFFEMLINVYKFIATIAGALAIVMLVVGGIRMMVSAGNSNLLGTGKKLIKYAIIGLCCVFLSWVIIDFTLLAIGFPGPNHPELKWWQLPFTCNRVAPEVVPGCPEGPADFGGDDGGGGGDF